MKHPNTNMKKPTIKIMTLAMVAGLGLLLGGCTTPDLKPFADSTAGLHQATVQTRDIVKTELREFKKAELFKDPDVLDNAEKVIPASFDARIKYMEAIVAYSDSLAAVADAAKNSQANAQALGDSVKGLADAVGPYGAAVGQAIPIFVTVAEKAEEAWAVHTLRQATKKAEPYIKGGAIIMESDMKNVRKILLRNEQPLIQKMEEPYANDLLIREEVIRLRNQETKKLLEALKQDNQGASVAAFNTNIAEYDKALENINQWYDPLQQREAEVTTRIEQEAQMVLNTYHGFQQWEKVHADLVTALENNRQPNIRELVRTVLEIKTEIDNLKKH